LLLQYKRALGKKGMDKSTAALCKARVSRTEVLLLTLNIMNTSAALLLPCLVIHWTQVGGASGWAVG